jgi:hypothetical protein
MTYQVRHESAEFDYAGTSFIVISRAAGSRLAATVVEVEERS